MSRFRGRSDFIHGRTPKTGILLCNLGTPAAPTTAAVRRYLAEFLSDPRVVELPRWLWLPLLHGIILNTRPRRSAHAYRTIWTDDGSPLLCISERLRDALADRLRDALGPGSEVALAMRYGEPAISTGLDQLIEAEARRILVVPLYPQYASATSASIHDAVFRYFATTRWIPELRFIADYHAHPGYIEALADSVRQHWTIHGRGERLLMSFHGIPRDTFLAGDPYFCQCQATARLLATALDLGEGDWLLSFQSRVGPKRWLEPYTEQTLREWGKAGTGDIDVICPGFSVDCLETLEEIAMQNADTFAQAGGGELRYVPALNDSEAHVGVLTALIAQHLGGWPAGEAEHAAALDDAKAAAERFKQLSG